jgi:hypothetical protein
MIGPIMIFHSNDKLDIAKGSGQLAWKIKKLTQKL